MKDSETDDQPTLGAESPLVSVVMSVFNDESYVDAAIESILDQSYTQLEFIIVNDGSTDASGSIIRERAASDDRISIIDRTVNLGLTSSLIEACGTASGKYIARQDADDISHPDRLARLVDTLESDCSIALVGTSAVRINSDSTTERKLFVPCHPLLLYLFLSWHNAFIHGSTMFRASAYRDVGGYNPDFKRSQDVRLWLDLRTVGRVINLKEVLYSLRRHPEQISEKSMVTQARYAARAHVLDRSGPGKAASPDELKWSVRNRLYFRLLLVIQMFVRRELRTGIKLAVSRLSLEFP